MTAPAAQPAEQLDRTLDDNERLRAEIQRLRMEQSELLEALKSADTALTECAKILRNSLPSFAENVLGAHLKTIRAAISGATGTA